MSLHINQRKHGLCITVEKTCDWLGQSRSSTQEVEFNSNLGKMILEDGRFHCHKNAVYLYFPIILFPF